jgi:IS5 family transposase|tara:strand:+ start:268 stop:486 length:219 start_codon:yes stop_codon:yes gene_type:complete
MLFGKDEEEDDNPIMFFNPDLMVNRLNLVIRLMREADKIKNDELRTILVKSANVTLDSVKKGLGTDATETYH